MPRKSFVLVWLALLVLSSAAFAQWNEEVLYSFQGYPDGAVPVGRIVVDTQGNVYGATLSGGSPSCSGPGGCGTVYELSPPSKSGAPWVETVLHVFKGRNFGDGSQPEGGLVMDAQGNLYGTTGYDGDGSCTLLGGVVGCGTVYEMSPPSQPGGAWTETILYSFQGGNDGYLPAGDLVFDKVGNLYGATLFGGGKGTNCGNSLYPNCGTIFELSPPQTKGGSWTEQVLHSFSGLDKWSISGDGSQPNGGVVIDDTGAIYGTAASGGSNVSICGSSGCGAIFELVPPKRNGDSWMESVLHRFQGYPNDGAGPNGGLILVDGLLYGTAFSGGSSEAGIVYSLQRAKGRNEWIETTPYTFLGSPNPSNPEGGLTFIGNDIVLGTALDGGTGFGGAAFRLMPPKSGNKWNLMDLYDFGRAPGAAGPIGELISNGADYFYGITQVGGTGQACDGGCGTVFAVWP